MKPCDFAYCRPGSVAECLAVLDEYGGEAMVLAGGQSAMPLLNMRMATPSVVVDVNGLGSLSDVAIGPDDVTLGSLVRAASIEDHGQVRQALPVLAQATRLIAHPQIRSRTTIGGSLCHADPSAELPTLAVAMGATMTLASRSRGARTVQADQFFLGAFTTDKRDDELLTAVALPQWRTAKFDYDEVAGQHGAFATVGMCLGLDAPDGVVAAARVAVCGVSGAPRRILGVEDLLAGQALAASVISDAVDVGEAELRESDPPYDDADYRIGLVKYLLRKLLRSHLTGADDGT